MLLSYSKVIKPLLDRFVAVLLLAFLWPILVVAALLVRLSSPGPILFVQERLGHEGHIFNAYKFRTMTHDESRGDRQVFAGDEGITWVGHYLRRLKVDELPQLFSVIKGDMSIVGPRPCLPALASSFDDNGRARLKMRPGLTGLAQVNGNIHLTWPERWKYDRQYVESVSFLLDAKIIAKTVLIVCFGEERYLNRRAHE